jgi:hypothetical protein
VFFKIDLRFGYHRLRAVLKISLRWLFSMRYDLYKYFVMSFGLANELTHFIYLTNFIFMSELDKFVVVFIDDILVYSKSMKEHEEHLQVMLQRL